MFIFLLSMLNTRVALSRVKTIPTSFLISKFIQFVAAQMRLRAVFLKSPRTELAANRTRREQNSPRTELAANRTRREPNSPRTELSYSAL